MTITDVKTIKITLPTDIWEILIVETDTGLRGWGEITGSLSLNGIGDVFEKFCDYLIGTNPLNIKECTKKFYEWAYPSVCDNRTYATALSGLDQALWDLTGKFYNLPLYKIYGADGKKEIPLYANLNKALQKDRRPEKLAENGKKAVMEGFSIVKCTPFDEITPLLLDCSLELAFEKMEALLGQVPVERIAIDCHQRFERHSLTKMLTQFKKNYGIPSWIEDPVCESDFESMSILRNFFPEISWASGEAALNFKYILSVMFSNQYEILIPDVKYIGGPSVLKSLIPAAEAYGKKVSLHNPNGIISTAHSAHLSALNRTVVPMEFPFGAVENRCEFCEPREQINNGKYILSDQPGIGVEITDSVMQQYAACYRQGCWIPYQGEGK